MGFITHLGKKVNEAVVSKGKVCVWAVCVTCVGVWEGQVRSGATLLIWACWRSVQAVLGVLGLPFSPPCHRFFF